MGLVSLSSPVSLSQYPKFCNCRYTHYWNSPTDAKKWKRIWPQLVADAAFIAGRAGVPLQHGTDDEKPPLISVKEGICINGVGSNGHESFHIRPSGNDNFNFCKTARKPYDLAVATILLRARTLMGEEFTFSSDGLWDYDREWIAAKNLFETIWPDIELTSEEIGIGFEEDEEP